MRLRCERVERDTLFEPVNFGVPFHVEHQYLWKTAQYGADPRTGEHHFAAPVHVRQIHRLQHGEISVDADTDENEARQVESENAEESCDSAGSVSSPPGHCSRPNYFQRHHQECYH